MDKIYNIKYVDAYHTYAKNINKTKLLLHEAHGYVKKNKDDIIIFFIKESGVSIETTIKEKKNIIKGLIIPDTAIISVVDTYKTDILKNIKIGSYVTVTWRDVVYVANLPMYDCSIMYTEGVLHKIEKDHIVLKDPETICIYPNPLKNHPLEKPTYYIIPIPFISDISVEK